jgi:hypothetical protein
VAQFKNDEDVLRWLDAKPREVANVFATRAALRAVPLLVDRAVDGVLGRLRTIPRQQVLRAFRAAAVSWARAAYPADRALRAAAATPINDSKIGLSSQLAAEYAAAASAPGEADAAAREFATRAVTHAIHACIEANARTINAILEAYSADADLLDGRIGPVAVANSQLWPGPSNTWPLDEWTQLRPVLLSADEDWDVWTDWYEDRLMGRTANQALEVMRATIPNELWQRGPHAVNAEIKRLIEDPEIFADATRPDGLSPQLAVLPLEELAVIGMRAGLRAVPLFYRGSFEEMVAGDFQLMLRAVSAAWVAAKYPPRERNRSRSYAANGAAAREASTDTVRMVATTLTASGVSPVELSPATLVAAAIEVLHSTSTKTDGPAAGAAFELALSQDLNDLRGANGAPGAAASLAGLELWPGGAPPQGMARRWSPMRRDLINAGVGWEVWVQWYEDRLAGRARSEAHELAYAELPDGLWEQGIAGDPAVVNTWIMRQLDRLADQGVGDPASEIAAVPEIPTPGPGPRYQVSPDGQIDRAPARDLDEQGNDLRTINGLKPLVTRAVSELRARLSPNEFPELIMIVEQYGAILNPGPGRGVEWGELWGLGVMLQNAASSAERQIALRLLPPLEDPAKSALDSLLTMHGPLILATSEGAELSAKAQAFAMTREQQADLRAASEQVAQQLTAHPEVITPRAAASVERAAGSVGEGDYPERGSVYALATMRNVSIVLIAGAAIVTPTLVGVLLGATIGAVVGAPFSFLVVEAVKKSSNFTALATQLGAHLDAMTDADLRGWVQEQNRRLAPFRSFVISNEEPLRKIAGSTSELKWMLRYIDFVVGKQ